jgi:hypothetical protein
VMLVVSLAEDWDLSLRRPKVASITDELSDSSDKEEGSSGVCLSSKICLS